MKPIQNSPLEPSVILVFGAHPDDIEFGCGAVIAQETRHGRSVQFVVCSRGEAGTNGTPAERTIEAERGATELGAKLHWLELDGDAHLEITAAHAIRLARVIREVRPEIILAPTLAQNQHPDHWRLGQLVRDAARLARFGGLAELNELTPHSIKQLLFYAVSPDAEPTGGQPIFIDVSNHEVVDAWKRSMEAHASQMKTRSYATLQLARATVNGGRCGAAAAIALYPNDPLVFDSLASLSRSARRL